MNDHDVTAFEQCIVGGGVAVFPTDTVYGIGCDVGNPTGARRVALIKDRDVAKPSAVMFFSQEMALAELTWLGDRTRAALEQLLPGPVTVIVPAGGPKLRSASRNGRIGIRVPKLEGSLAPLRGAECVVLQTSANMAGGPDPRTIDQVPREILEAVNLRLDGGELAGVASTVVDLTRYEREGEWEMIREGDVLQAEISRMLG